MSWYDRNASYDGALTYGGMLKDGSGWIGWHGNARIYYRVIGRKARLCRRVGLTIGELVREKRESLMLGFGGMFKDGVDGVDS